MRAKKLLTIAVLALSPLLLPAPAHALVILGDWAANLDRVATRDGGVRIDLLSGGAFADLPGVPPEPIRDPMGLLDFSGAFDVTLGSLTNVGGVTLTALDGTVDRVAPFSIRDVPEPAPLALLALGLAGLFALRRRASRSLRPGTGSLRPGPRCRGSRVAPARY